MRRTILAAAIFQIVFQVARCFGQTAPASPAFEVASVKVSHEPPGSDSSKSTPGTFVMRNMTLRAIIAMAYSTKELQVLAGPKWLDSERYDIDAKSAGPAPGTELRVMLQTLLAQRFQVALHRESKIFPGYALVVTKSGLKMRSVEPGSSGINIHNTSMTASRVTMAAMANNLSRRLGAPVADATGVTGAYDFQLELPPQADRRAPANGDIAAGEASDPASYATALSHVFEDQLGVKLAERKVPQEVLVIDRAEKPVQN